MKHHGDNRYKDPRDGVREKYNRGEALNKCCLMYNEFMI